MTLVATGHAVSGVSIAPRTHEVESGDLPGYDGIIYGSPTYFGVMATEVKDLIDRSVECYGKLDGKAGGAFTSSGMLAGGNETTIMAILQTHLIHGMVVQGDTKTSHYGPVAVEEPDERAAEECVRYGKRFAALVMKLSK